MTINELHRQLLDGTKSIENELFSKLSARFRYVAQQRIGNRLDAEEIVQDSLADVANKYRSIEFKTSFSAWAYKVLHLNILDYYRKKNVRVSSMLPMPSEELLVAADNPDTELRLRLKDCMRKLRRDSIRLARILHITKLCSFCLVQQFFL